MRASRAGWLLLGLLGSLPSCAPKPPPVKSQLEVVEREQTWQKLYERGRAFAAVGDQTRAEQYLAAAVAAGGDSQKITPLLMAVCVEAQKYRVAIDYGQAHLRKYPDDTRLRHLVGTMHMALGEGAQAKSSFEEVLKRSPDAAETHYALGVLYRDIDHDLLRADQHFRAYIRNNPAGPHAQDARASLLKVVP